MIDREMYALELNLLQKIDSKKTPFWHKLLAAFELSVLVDQH